MKNIKIYIHCIAACTLLILTALPVGCGLSPAESQLFDEDVSPSAEQIFYARQMGESICLFPSLGGEGAKAFAMLDKAQAIEVFVDGDIPPINIALGLGAGAGALGLGGLAYRNDGLVKPRWTYSTHSHRSVKEIGILYQEARAELLKMISDEGSIVANAKKFEGALDRLAIAVDGIERMNAFEASGQKVSVYGSSLKVAELKDEIKGLLRTIDEFGPSNRYTKELATALEKLSPRLNDTLLTEGTKGLRDRFNARTILQNFESQLINHQKIKRELGSSEAMAFDRPDDLREVARYVVALKEAPNYNSQEKGTLLKALKNRLNKNQSIYLHALIDSAEEIINAPAHGKAITDKLFNVDNVLGKRPWLFSAAKVEPIPLTFFIDTTKFGRLTDRMGQLVRAVRKKPLFILGVAFIANSIRGMVAESSFKPSEIKQINEGIKGMDPEDQKMYQDILSIYHSPGESCKAGS